MPNLVLVDFIIETSIAEDLLQRTHIEREIALECETESLVNHHHLVDHHHHQYIHFDFVPCLSQNCIQIPLYGCQPAPHTRFSLSLSLISLCRLFFSFFFSFSVLPATTTRRRKRRRGRRRRRRRRKRRGGESIGKRGWGEYSDWDSVHAHSSVIKRCVERGLYGNNGGVATTEAESEDEDGNHWRRKKCGDS